MRGTGSPGPSVFRPIPAPPCWWSPANEYAFLRTKTDADRDRMGTLVQQNDPNHHLLSIHNGTLLFDHRKPWISHISIQNGVAVESPGSAELYGDVSRKPVVYDEVKYEGDAKFRGADLSGRDMVHRFWCGTAGGTYVGHGDYFNPVEEDTWDMTITPVAGEFVTRKKDRYHFVNAQGRSVPLPGKPGIAVRIHLLSVKAGVYETTKPMEPY